MGQRLARLRRPLRPRAPGGAEERPRVSVLVVTYNGPRHLARFLRSVRATRGVAYELVVVDNASRLPTRLVLAWHHTRGTVDSVTFLDRNTLFSPGVNTALRVSDPRSDHVLLLNPDVVIHDPDWLCRLLALHERGATGLGYLRKGPRKRTDGFCFLVDRDLIQEAGGLSEDFHWWWAVTKLQADLLQDGHTVQAVTHYRDLLTHVGGGSGAPPTDARGMDVTAEQVRGWFGEHRVKVTDLRGVAGASYDPGQPN